MLYKIRTFTLRKANISWYISYLVIHTRAYQVLENVNFSENVPTFKLLITYSKNTQQKNIFSEPVLYSGQIYAFSKGSQNQKFNDFFFNFTMKHACHFKGKKFHGF